MSKQSTLFTDDARLYWPGEVAELIGVHPRTISDWARQDLIPCVRTPGGHRRFTEEVVQVLLHDGLPEHIAS